MFNAVELRRGISELQNGRQVTGTSAEAVLMRSLSNKIQEKKGFRKVRGHNPRIAALHSVLESVPEEAKSEVYQSISKQGILSTKKQKQCLAQAFLESGGTTMTRKQKKKQKERQKKKHTISV